MASGMDDGVDALAACREHLGSRAVEDGGAGSSLAFGVVAGVSRLEGDALSVPYSDAGWRGVAARGLLWHFPWMIA